MKVFNSFDECYSHFTKLYKSNTLCFELINRQQKRKIITEKFKVMSKNKHVETVEITFQEDD